MNICRLSLVFVIFLVGFMPVLGTDADDKAVQEYLSRLQKTIRNNWKPNKSDKSYNLTASFKIDKFGTVRDLKLINKLDDEEANNAAIEAIKLSEPFSSPAYLNISSIESHGTIEIEFDFDYNVQKTFISAEHKEIISKEIQQIKESPMVQNLAKSSQALLKLFRFIFYALIVLLIIYFRVTSIFKNLDESGSPKKTNMNNKPNRYDPTNVTERK